MLFSSKFGIAELIVVKQYLYFPSQGFMGENIRFSESVSLHLN